MKRQIFIFLCVAITVCVILTSILLAPDFPSIGREFLISMSWKLVIALSIVYRSCYIFAVWLTRRLVDPINSIDLNNFPGEGKDNVCDELSPFIKKVKQQHEIMEDKLADIENRAQTIDAIIKNMKEGFVLLNVRGIVLTANNSALRIFNVTRSCVGKRAILLTRNVEFGGNVKRAADGEACVMIYETENRSYQVFFNPVDNVGVIILFLDITDNLKSESIRREFSANVSHELKTPLTCIQGYAEMIVSGMAKKEDFTSFAGKIGDETARMIKLVDDIMLISHLDESGGDKSFERFDALDLAAGVADSLRHSADKQEIVLSVTGEPLMINANMRLIHELLLNLMENAVKYNIKGGEVCTSISREGEYCVITVSDTGIGIPSEHLERVFERFYRVDKSRAKKTGGTGLGLSIVKHIAQYHNGTVGISSEENKGTTLTVKIKGLEE